MNSYIESSYRCVDGSSQITRHLSKVIKEMGGEIFNYSEAVKFHFKNDEIDEVELKNGERVAGKLFFNPLSRLSAYFASLMATTTMLACPLSMSS